MSRYRSRWKRKQFTQKREILTWEYHDYLVEYVYPMHDNNKDAPILSFTDYYKQVFHAMGLKGKLYNQRMRRIYYLRNRQHHLDKNKEWEQHNHDKRLMIEQRHHHRHRRKRNRQAREYNILHRSEIAKRKRLYAISK